MPQPNIAPELPDRDKLITRPDEEALPAAQDLKAPIQHPTDPKPVPKEGQGTDPKAGDIGRAT
jgi:hypothetical protein